MPKAELLAHLKTKGKDQSWEQLAKEYGIRSGEAARCFWKKQRSKHTRENTKYQQGFWEEDLRQQKDLLLREIKRSVPVSTRRPTICPQNADTLLELSIPDLHLGKLSWSIETGENYDVSIAADRFQSAITELLSRVNLKKIERIHFPIGNDAIHIDNPENTTTAGTSVDTDGRFPKILRTAKEIFVATIDYLKRLAPVDVTIVRGNHDSVTMFMLGEILDAWFHDDPQVTVNNSPKLRKYYQYGRCGFLLTHGDKERHQDLALIFATEEPQLWADTKFRFCKLGHLHKSKKTEYVSVDSLPGVQIEILPSLSGTDEWHYSRGYISNKQAKAFVYDKEKGEIASYTYTV